MTDLELLAHEVGVHERTLRRAVTQGSLRAVRPTPRTLHMPLSERQYARRSWPLLAALRTALRTEHNVRFALLFGSAARGSDVPGSDLDVLVRLREPSLERIIDLGAKLSTVIGRRVDLIRLEDAQAEPSFLADVLTDGRVLVDREASWPRLRGRATELRRESQRSHSRRAQDALAAVDRLIPK